MMKPVNLPESVKGFVKLVLNKFGVSTAEWRPYLWDISQVERIVEYGWVIQNLEGVKVLDIGCWGTLFPIQLASLGYRVVGVDLRDYSYFHPNFEFIKGDLFDPKIQREIIKRGQFNNIILISTLEHIGILLREKIDLDADLKALNFLKQTLKEGGTILVTIPFGKSKILKRRKQKNEQFSKEWVPWLRVYDEKRLKEFSKLFSIEKIDIYFRDNGNWKPTNIDMVKNINYPEFGAKIKSIACIKMRRI